jgi:hypothetical protein
MGTPMGFIDMLTAKLYQIMDSLHNIIKLIETTKLNRCCDTDHWAWNIHSS